MAAPKKPERPRRKAAAPAKPKKRPRRGAKPTSEDLERYATLNETIIHLAVEAVEGRVRHRALIDTLRSGKAFEWPRYMENFVAVKERDFMALFDSLLLTDEAYKEEYDEWLKTDLVMYGLPPDTKLFGTTARDNKQS